MFLKYVLRVLDQYPKKQHQCYNTQHVNCVGVDPYQKHNNGINDSCHDVAKAAILFGFPGHRRDHGPLWH